MGLRVKTIATEVVRFAVCVHLYRNIPSMHKTQKITLNETPTYSSLNFSAF